MRKPYVAAIVLALICVCAGGSARADRLHLPCDQDMAVSIGTGAFFGHTSDISFERIQPTFFRLEGTVFDNCGAYDPKAGRHRLTRHWLGRLDVYGSLAPENSSLGFTHKPGPQKDADGNIVYETDADGNPVLDADGQPVPVIESTLTKADLATDIDWTGGFGARLSIYDGKHFHLEAFGEYVGTFGWNPAYGNTVTAHAAGLDLDITDIVAKDMQLQYKWGMWHGGFTIAFPLRPTTISKLQLTPFLTIGYMRFKAVIDVAIDQELTDTLIVLGVDPAKITERRVIQKESPTVSIGARLDLNHDWSLEGTAMFGTAAALGLSSHTTAYWFTGSLIYRFDFPWKWGRK